MMGWLGTPAAGLAIGIALIMAGAALTALGIIVAMVATGRMGP